MAIITLIFNYDIHYKWQLFLMTIMDCTMLTRKSVGLPAHKHLLHRLPKTSPLHLRRHARSSQTQLVSKSISFTARGDHSAGILRQHDTLGVLPIQALFFAHKMLTSPSEKCDNSKIIDVIGLRVMIVS